MGREDLLLFVAGMPDLPAKTKTNTDGGADHNIFENRLLGVEHDTLGNSLGGQHFRAGFVDNLSD